MEAATMARQRSQRRDTTDLTGLRTGVYLRVSRADDCKHCKGAGLLASGQPCPRCEGTGFEGGAERSTETQRRIYDQWAEHAGVTLADEYADPDMSASRFRLKKNRPEFERMVADVQAGKLDILWFWEISRQQRELSVFAELRDLCRAKGVLWVMRDRVVDPADSRDMFMATIQTAVAEDESEKLSIRVFDGKESSAVKGKRAGKIPYGYKRGIYNPDTDTFGPDQPDVFDGDGRAVEDSPAAVVREIFGRIKMGESITGIRRDLNDRGLRTKPDKNHPEGSRWDNAQIRYIAMNPTYAGMRVRHIDHAGGLSNRASKILEGVKPAWPPLVDTDTFWAVYRKLADPARTTTKTDRPGGRLLSAVARCGACKSKLTVHKPSPGRRQRDDVYTCKDRACVGVFVSDLEDYVTEVMIRWLSQPETAAQLAGNGDAEALKLAHADLDRANAEHGELLRSAKRGGLTLVMAEAMEQEILKRIEDAKQRIEDATIPPVLQGVIGEQATDGWAALTVPQRRQVIAAVADIRVHRVGRHGNQQIPVRDRVEWRWLIGPGAGEDAGRPEDRIQAHYAARKAQYAERRAKVAHLRAEGWSRAEIAAEVGLSVSAVAKDIAVILAEGR
jgi:DNA invertase Pin-like site-specific DNA recombinase